jgi:hypothetical protein
VLSAKEAGAQGGVRLAPRGGRQFREEVQDWAVLEEVALA